MTEELGVVPNGSSVSVIGVELRKNILEDKMAFINALKDGDEMSLMMTWTMWTWSATT